MNRRRALGYSLRMIFPENRFALFRIMLYELRWRMSQLRTP